MFNSIVEASHLGSQADGILEISTTIKRISATWGEITTGSEAATEEIRTLVEASKEGLRAARSETMGSLGILREAAKCAEIGSAGNRLEVCFGQLDTARTGIESAQRALEQEGGPGSGTGFDAEAVERRFSADYTTEMERAVLRAALAGGPMPVAQPNFAGNSVELF
jgi:hypothetical protein